MKTLFDTWKISDFQKQKEKILWVFILILLTIVVIIYTGMRGIRSELRHQKLYLTPAQVLQGGYYKTNKIPDAFVYGFAYQMFVAINTWSINAKSDYNKNIINYRYYITPRYRQSLQSDYQSSLQTGNIVDSMQTISPYNGMGFVSGKQVKRTGPNSWTVSLTLRVARYKDNAVLMDALYDYKIKVTRTAESIEYNPWGLSLDGLIAKTRLKTFV
jgi:integrating conjugative element protein (TIGR03746 family)